MDNRTPVSDATVTATWENNGQEERATATTDGKGIYALVAPPNTDVALEVTYAGQIPLYLFGSKSALTVRTGLSETIATEFPLDVRVGNLCQQDLVASFPRIVILPGLDEIEKIYDKMNFPYQKRGVTAIRDGGLGDADIFVACLNLPAQFAAVYTHTKELIERGGYMLATTDAHAFVKQITPSFALESGYVGMDLQLGARFPIAFGASDTGEKISALQLASPKGPFEIAFEQQGWPIINNIGGGSSLLVANSIVAMDQSSGFHTQLSTRALGVHQNYGAGSITYTSFPLELNYRNGNDDLKQLVENIALMPIRDYKKISFCGLWG